MIEVPRRKPSERKRRAIAPPPQCTCGKVPGTSGPHKSGCPLRVDGFFTGFYERTK